MLQDPEASQATLSEAYGGEVEAIPKSLWEWLTTEARANLNGTALIATHQAPHCLSNLVEYQADTASHLSWSYSQLLSAVEKLSSYCAEHKIVAGDTIFAFTDNSNAAEWTLLFWTAIRLGATFVPLDPVTLGRSEEMQSLVKSLKPAMVVVQDMQHAEQFDARDASPKLKLLCSEEDGTHSWRSISRVKSSAASSATQLPIPEVDPDSIALIMCTSGSTNRPKGCPITARVLVSQTRQYHSFYRSQFDWQTRHLVTTANFRPICYLSCLNAWAAGSATIFYGRDFDALKTLNTFKEMSITHAWFVPAMVNLLHQQFIKVSKDTKATQGAKCVLMSGDTATREVVAKGQEMFPPECTRFIPHWGMSEGAPLFGFVGQDAQTMKYDKHSDIAGIGRALAGTRVKICLAGTTDRLVKRGEQGELHVSSVATIGRYLDGRGAEEFYDDDTGRWFKTGDTAVMDRSGIVYIVGRTKDVIKYKGLNLLPTVLEGCLKQGFQLDAVVTGLKHEVFGDVAAAVVKGLPEGQDRKQEMEAYVREQQGEDRGLEGGVWRLEELGMEDWPYNSSGKIQKRDLASAIMSVR